MAAKTVRRAPLRRASTASEHSLLRSFSAIRAPPGNVSANHGDDLADCRGRPEARKTCRRRSDVTRGEAIPRGELRDCGSPTGTASSSAPEATSISDDEPAAATRGAAAPACHESRDCRSPTGTTSSSAPDPASSPVDAPAGTPARCQPSDASTQLPTPPFGRPAGFRHDYQLGDPLVDPAHARVAPAGAAAALRVHDFAFVRRSDGDFTYAIFAYRSAEPVRRGGRTVLEECMTFVTSPEGHTKTVSRRRWDERVRLVAVEGDAERPPLDAERPPVEVVAFDWREDEEQTVVSDM